MNVKKRKRFVGTICLMLSMVLLTVPMLGIHTTRDCRIRCFPCARATRRRSSTRTATVTAA